MTEFGKYGKNADPAFVSQAGLNGDVTNRNILSLSNSEVRQDTVVVKSDSVVKPTMEQIRYWKWQQNKKMFITDSRYLPTRTNVDIAHTESIRHTGIELPFRPLNRYSTDWLTIALLAALVLLATVRVGYAKYIGTLFQSVINYSTSFRMFREKNYSILHGASRLEALYYIVFSLFVFQVVIFFSYKTNHAGLVLYGETLGLVILYFLVKKTVYRILGTIFNGVQETSEFIFNIDNFNRVTGILLLPVVALLAFYPYERTVFIIILGGLTVAGLYVFLLQRGISILLKKQFSIYYLFLYLCTLEFIPLLLIYKIVAE